jgi:divalent metal cation (Fe/Co/Zn/Cd) transporter
MQYSIQGLNCDGIARKDLLMDIGAEQLNHLEIVSALARCGNAPPITRRGKSVRMVSGRMTEPAADKEWFPQLSDARKPPRSPAVIWIQSVTVVWMLVECGVALVAASWARSPALLAFGSDSLVELLSAGVVFLQFVPHLTFPEERATRAAALLLFVLAAVVTSIAALSLLGKVRPEASPLGIAVTGMALVIMPVLAWLKRREARRLNNPALAADAVQSATCAYLALITIAGLAINAAFHAGWFDAAAALLTVPLLLKEGRAAWHGRSCGCCGRL